MAIIAALGAGAAIGYVDTRPAWDDTGVTAVATFVVSAVLASLRPAVALLVALAVGLPVLAFNIVARSSYGAAAVFGFSLAGACVGYGLSRAVGGDGAR